MNALNAFFDLVVESSLRCTLLIGLWLLVRPFLRGRVPAWLIFAAWLVIGLRLILPFAISTQWSPYYVAKVWLQTDLARKVGGSSAKTAESIWVSFSPPISSPAVEPKVSSSDHRNGSQPSSIPPRRSIVTIKSFVIWLWIAGMTGLALIRGASAFVFWRKVRRQSHGSDPRLVTLVAATASELKLDRPIEILVSGAVPAPAVSGWWRPKLLFPSDFASALTDADLRWVILHELGHWTRRDGWAQALLEWGRILHWFNPVVWLCGRIARLDCELACDEYVIARADPGEPADYGVALLKILARVRTRTPVVSVVGIFESKKQLKKRIQMIANYRASTFGRVLVGSVLLVVVVFVSATREIRAQPSKDTAPPPSSSSTNKAPGASAAPITQTVPAGWFVNGSHPRSYVVGLDATEIHVAPVSSYIKSIEPDIPGFGGMMQSFDAKDYHGKRVRFSAWIKTTAVSKSANIWMRVDGPRGVLRFDNIDNRAPKGTKDWQQYTAVLDVSEEAQTINIGFFVSGTGQAWFNDAKFDVVDESIQETDMPIAHSRPKQKPTTPQNLSFETGLPE